MHGTVLVSDVEFLMCDPLEIFVGIMFGVTFREFGQVEGDMMM
jgi:hypothetical protein